MKKLLLLLVGIVMLASCSQSGKVKLVKEDVLTRTYKAKFPNIGIVSIIKSRETRSGSWKYSIGDTVLVNTVNGFIAFVEHGEKAVITEYTN